MVNCKFSVTFYHRLSILKMCWCVFTSDPKCRQPADDADIMMRCFGPHHDAPILITRTHYTPKHCFISRID